MEKFQLAQHVVKLVGEKVCRECRSPNPDVCRAVRQWPPICNLKDLQMFLGTLNYIRPHCGPAFGRVMTPLRELLRPTGKFPPNAAQLGAIEGLKDLVNEMHILYVPDEAAAIQAAQAWCAGLPPAGRGYEMGADTSKIAMGGVLGQAERPGGRLRILAYWSCPLTPAQSLWHPFE